MNSLLGSTCIWTIRNSNKKGLIKYFFLFNRYRRWQHTIYVVYYTPTCCCHNYRILLKIKVWWHISTYQLSFLYYLHHWVFTFSNKYSIIKAGLKIRPHDILITYIIKVVCLLVTATLDISLKDTNCHSKSLIFTIFDCSGDRPLFILDSL